MLTDPIADMLSRIRNANKALHENVRMPSSRVKREIARLLKEEGYIANFKPGDGKPVAQKPPMIRIYLRYGPNLEKVITDLQRVSKPGCRIYCRKDGIPRVYGGLGINILSTPKGLMTGRAATQAGVGGEILCNVW